MLRRLTGRLLVLNLVFLYSALTAVHAVGLADEKEIPATGPRTEKRFPPLVVPAGFKATLFACDPLVEYPSVIAIGPKEDSLFVAHDYVTGLGVNIIKQDEVRLLSDTNGDGYADASQRYAGGFNSIQGLAFHDGFVFVMHAPLLTKLRDTDGDGVADIRLDLVEGLGLPPEKNDNRLHCANGVVVGHDGWLYLALGDRGCDVQRPEGDRLLFQEGGVLRCREDGRDLHVFASGLRNIYDIALDEELNVFVRDNENDGGDYMIRVCHSFHGADHGYPYLYRDRPEEAMPPLADLGRGSSAGAAAYLESAFPPSYRQSLFFCEWGRAVVRYPKHRSGATFQSNAEEDFAAGAPSDPYGFKPTDLVVDRDGSLLISDWCDGQRPKRGRGRIYRVSAVAKTKFSGLPKTQAASNKQLFEMLGSESHHRRLAAQDALWHRLNGSTDDVKLSVDLLAGLLDPASSSALARMHAVWIYARASGGSAIAIELLLDVAQKDPDPRVQAQALRAIGDLADPILAQHRISAERGDQKLGKRLAELFADADPRVRLELLVALGRLRWADAPQWLAKNWRSGDSAQAHAAMMLLRRCRNWPQVLKLLDVPSSPQESTRLRALVLQSIGDRADAVIVDGLLARLKTESDATRRGEYLDVLARAYKRPAEWVYWGFRPAPRPANVVAWDRTSQIEETLDLALADPSSTVRRVALRRMRREKIPVPIDSLAAWLRSERQARHVAAILESLQDHSAELKEGLLLEVINSRQRDVQNRLAAFRYLETATTARNEMRLLRLAESLGNGPVLAEVLESLGRRANIPANRQLMAKLSSKSPAVRAAAISALGRRNATEAVSSVTLLLADSEIEVRRAAATVAGELMASEAGPMLLRLAASQDSALRNACLTSLRQLRHRGAVQIATDSLKSKETQLPALRYLREFGATDQLTVVANVAKANRSTEIATAVGAALSRWMDDEKTSAIDRQNIRDSLAKLHGESGSLVVWSVLGPISEPDAKRLFESIGKADSGSEVIKRDSGWRRVVARGVDSVVSAPSTKGSRVKGIWIGSIELSAAAPAQAQFLAGADGLMEVWLNGRPIFSGKKESPLRSNSETFEGALVAGKNRVQVKLVSSANAPRFQIRMRRKSSKLELERRTQLLLAGRGNVERGRELFVNAEKSLCLKCHRLGDKGNRIGPDLSGIGSRFSRIHLIESLLEPSRTIAPSYASMVVALKSGVIRAGVKIAETQQTISLADKDGNTHTIPHGEIEETRPDKTSIMPEGIEKRMTDRELTDLIAFLISQQKK